MDLPEPDRTRFVELNRTRLRLWEWGTPGDPVVLCAHGGHDHGRMWDGFAPRLAALGYHVVAPDLRGHGDSGRLSCGRAWAVVSLDLAVLARELGAPVGLVGHSFGGGQALNVAGVWPELVRWVVNLDGIGPPTEAFAGEPDIAAAAESGVRAAERALFGTPRLYPTREAMAERRARVNVRLPRPWLDHLVRHGSVATEGGYAWKADPLFNVGLPGGDFSPAHLRAEYQAVAAPVLVVTGREHDTWSELSPAEVAERVGWIPGARHVEVPGAGHYVHLEQPDAVLAAVCAFLAEVEP